ncbi:MAG: polysaccharide deacetylase family protein [Candidatus Eisenbacteria bacterium]|nr:polysaccharide deacetylase family protein [Candidatus Eisenbacteria bacterium]
MSAPGSRLRNSIRWLVGSTSTALGLPSRYAIRRRLGGKYGIILGYHRVIPDEEPFSPYRIGMARSQFERQALWIATRHEAVDLEEMLWWIASDRVPAHDLVALTFDDGYRDNLTVAAPVLSRLGLPATFYVTAAGILGTGPLWTDLLAQTILRTDAPELALSIDGRPLAWSLADDERRAVCCDALIRLIQRRPIAEIGGIVERVGQLLEIAPARAGAGAPTLLTAEDVRALASSGFSIGSHTISHTYLPGEPPEVQRREIEDSKRIIEDALRAPVRDFCYPGGGHDERSRRLAKEAGYRSATTWEAGIVGSGDDPYRLCRKGIGEALARNPLGRFSSMLMEAEVSGFMRRALRRRRARRAEVACADSPPPGR